MGKTPPHKRETLHNKKKKEKEGEGRRTQDDPPSTNSFTPSIKHHRRKQSDAKGFVKISATCSQQASTPN